MCTYIYVFECILKEHKILPVCILVFHWEILRVYDYMTIGDYTEQNGINQNACRQTSP